MSDACVHMPIDRDKGQCVHTLYVLPSNLMLWPVRQDTELLALNALGSIYATLSHEQLQHPPRHSPQPLIKNQPPSSKTPSFPQPKKKPSQQVS